MQRNAIQAAVVVFGVFLGSWLSSQNVAWAQPDQGKKEASPPLNIFNALGGANQFGSLGDGENLTLTANLLVEKGSRDGKLRVTAEIAPGWHLYSTTQPKGGPLRSKMSVSSQPELEAIGEFTPNPPPHVRMDDIFPGVPIEEHEEKVVWIAPVRLPIGGKPEAVAITVKFSGQVCHDMLGCVPQDLTLVAKFAGYSEPIATVARYRAKNSHVEIEGYADPQVVAPGQIVKLVITATPDRKYHIYDVAEMDRGGAFKPTLIVLSDPPRWKVTGVTADSKPKVHRPLPDEPAASYFEKPVTWTMQIRVPQDAKVGELTIAGMIGYQTCKDEACDPPTAAQFSAKMTIAESAGEGQSPLAFQGAKYTQATALIAAQNSPPGVESGPPKSASSKASAAPSGFDPTKLNVNSSGEAEVSVYYAIWLALVGGFILNFMPCVLPVIGLKVMSFVHQAGENRSRALLLNVWYSLGLLSVFLVLATLAVVWNFGWGQQNQFGAFNITMASIVFVMGLSFLGVWEIPIPGFVGSGKAADLAHREGPFGAFLKGIITTILAVPCSGPGIASALAWCNAKPAPVVYAVFACMGLGMACPYLVIGANPRLAKLLPRPGAWMETFKQLMGFVLLGTVVFVLSYLAWADVLPTIALLFGLWAACWWIGRIPSTADLPAVLRNWSCAAFFAALIGIIAFGWLRGVMDERLLATVDRINSEHAIGGTPTGVRAGDANPNQLAWQPFTAERLQQLTSEGKTVLVDFTADWCLTCKVLEKTVLNTKDVRDAVERNQIVTLVADWTDRNEKISQMLELLGSKQVPVLAIFPSGRANEPIVILGGYTKSSLLEKLEQAAAKNSSAPPAPERQAKR